jgi:Lon protease-like protein
MSAGAGDPLASFAGTARLFPLPNLVFFPHAVQPLHVFEPRYRQLMEDALAGDRLMALALLCPGWEQDYHKQPPIHPVVCLGQIAAEERLADGRFNLLLRGLRRARILEEVPTGRLYRTARVQLLEDVPPPDAQQSESLRRRLAERMAAWHADRPDALAQLERVLAGGLPLGALCDLVGFALPMNLKVKQMLLEEVEVERRAGVLLRELDLQRMPRPGRTFPPDFSTN